MGYGRTGQVETVTDTTGTRDLVYDPAKPWRLTAEAHAEFYGSRVLTRLYDETGTIGRVRGFQLGATAGSNSDLFNGPNRVDHSCMTREFSGVILQPVRPPTAGQMKMEKRFRLMALAATLAMMTRIGGHAQSATESVVAQALPPLAAVLAVHGKPISSREFLDLKRQSGLRLHSRADKLDRTFAGLLRVPPNQHKVRTEVVYGGSGLVLVATSESIVVGDLDETWVREVPVVEKIRLVVGGCFEADAFGRWKGEMPPFELPASPESLLESHPGCDSDILDATYSNAATALKRGLVNWPRVSQTRTINYFVPPVLIRFPYAFVFRFDQLAMVEVWPSLPPGKIIRPQTPAAGK